MAVFSGKDGTLQWQNAAVTRVRNWSLQSTLDALEVTNLGQIAREYAPLSHDARFLRLGAVSNRDNE